MSEIFKNKEIFSEVEMDEQFGIPKACVVNPHEVTLLDGTKRMELDINNFWQRFYGAFDVKRESKDDSRHDWFEMNLNRTKNQYEQGRGDQQKVELARRSLELWQEFKIDHPDLHKILEEYTLWLQDIRKQQKVFVEGKCFDEYENLEKERQARAQEMYPKLEEAYKILSLKGIPVEHLRA